jgi:hypothetical protein
MADARLPHSISHQNRKALQMRARRDFRHHTAEGRVFRLLAEDGLGQNYTIRTKHCGRGFIATALNAQNEEV